MAHIVVRLSVPDGLGTAALFGIDELWRSLTRAGYHLGHERCDHTIELLPAADWAQDVGTSKEERGQESYDVTVGP
jgi:hypothetical protein